MSPFIAGHRCQRRRGEGHCQHRAQWHHGCFVFCLLTISRCFTQDIAVSAGAVKAIVNIARTGTLMGRDCAATALAELSAADSKPAMVKQLHV